MRGIPAISSEADYDRVLTELAIYFENQPARGSEAAQRFDVLSDLIEAYEAKHWPIEPKSPPSGAPR